MLSNDTYYLMYTHTHTHTHSVHAIAHVNTSVHRLEQNAQNSTHIPVHRSLPNFICGILIPVDTVPDQLRVLSASSTGLPTKCVPANGPVLVSVWKLVGLIIDLCTLVAVVGECGHGCACVDFSGYTYSFDR